MTSRTYLPVLTKTANGNVTEHYCTGEAKNVLQAREIHGNIHLNWSE